MIDYNEELLNNLITYNKNRFLSFKNNLPFETNEEYERLLNARVNKVGRIKKRLLYLLIRYEYIWFCTFTFNNNYINKCERTKRDLIKQVLNKYDFKYILNIDYGKQTQRQHFHCILATNFDLDINKLFQENYSGGFSKSIQCKKGLDDFKRLTKYIDKLVNHCIKATTNKQRLVYNFKGYDLICPDSRTKTIAYNLDLDKLKSVTRLDKGDTTGNFI